MAGERCKHDRVPDDCNQCRLESLTTHDLLVEVETYENMLQVNGFIPRGWWVELAHRLRTHAPAPVMVALNPPKCTDPCDDCGGVGGQHAPVC
jgi:hypothetical protein